MLSTNPPPSHRLKQVATNHPPWPGLVRGADLSAAKAKKPLCKCVSKVIQQNDMLMMGSGCFLAVLNRHFGTNGTIILNMSFQTCFTVKFVLVSEAAGRQKRKKSWGTLVYESSCQSISNIY